MSNFCPQPGCGAEYDLSTHPVGTQFTCQQCGQVLRVEADGLHLASAATPGTRPPFTQSQFGSYVNTQASQVWGRMQGVADLPTWLFGTGAVIALCALFFPIMDRAQVSRLEAMIVAGDMRQDRVNAI